MLFPSRVSQLNRKISTKQTLSHHKTTWFISNTDVPTQISHTMPELVSETEENNKIGQSGKVTEASPRCKPKASTTERSREVQKVDITSLMQGTKTTRSPPPFLLLHFENATRTIQMRWRRIFLPTFCVRGKKYSERMKATTSCSWHQTHFPKQEFCFCRYAIYRPPCWTPTLYFRPVSCRNSYRSVRWTRQAMHVWRNMEARSRNHWCLEKALSVCVWASVIQDSKRMRLLYCHLSAWLCLSVCIIFSTLSHKWNGFL
jgi:hypothetical protein